MNFGFSYVGVIYLLMLFIPNGIWAKNMPEGYLEVAKYENKILGIGHIGIHYGHWKESVLSQALEQRGAATGLNEVREEAEGDRTAEAPTRRGTVEL